MKKQTLRVVVALTCLPLAGHALFSTTAQSKGSESTQECINASITDLHFESETKIDELSVTVLGHTTSLGPEIILQHGEFERSLTAPFSKELSFTTPLVGSLFRLSVMPDLDSQSKVCVKEIELRYQGSGIKRIAAR